MPPGTGPSTLNARDPETAALAGFALALLGEAEGLKPLLSYRRTQPGTDHAWNQRAYQAIAELGPLRQLVAHTQAGGESDGTDDPRQAYAQMMQMPRDDLPLEPEPVMEAQGAQPGEVSFRVAISASFDLKERP